MPGYDPHDERVNAYYVSAFKNGNEVIDCYEGDTVFSCCTKHLREQLVREGHTRIRIRRAWDYERVYFGR